MAGVQLRRYDIVAGQMDTFLENWQRLVPVREKYGFTVTLALADRVHDQFVWAVSHDDDFEAAERAYNHAPEKAGIVAGIRPTMAGSRTGMVDVIVGL